MVLVPMWDVFLQKLCWTVPIIIQDALKKFSQHGINVDNWVGLRANVPEKADVVQKNTEGLEFLMKKNNITYVTGTASLWITRQSKSGMKELCKK